MRLLLDRLCEALDEKGAEKLEASPAWYDRLYGAKSTLSATLLTVADLVLKLEGVQQQAAKAEAAPGFLSEADAQLVDRFIARMRAADDE